MNIEFIKRFHPKGISFWEPRVRYDFEISYGYKEDIDLFEKEFRLNCKNQLMF